MIIADNGNGHSAHWYSLAGEPQHEVPRAKGEGTRPTTLADAREMGLLPSVTTVEQILDKPGLTRWKAQTAILSALTGTRGDGESLDDYAERVAEEAEGIAKAAADTGTRIHKALEAWHTNGSKPWPAGHEATCQSYGQLAFGLEIEQGEPERVVVHSALGYAGRVDLSGPGFIVDWKTTGTKPGRKVTGYESWPRQLAAYAEAVQAPPDTRLLNIVLSTTEPGRVEVIDQTPHRESAFREFRAILWLWCLLKGYWPAGEFDLAPVAQIMPEAHHAVADGLHSAESLFPAQVAGLRQLATGEGRMTLDIPVEAWPVVAVRASVGTMVEVCNGRP